MISKCDNPHIVRTQCYHKKKKEITFISFMRRYFKYCNQGDWENDFFLLICWGVYFNMKIFLVYYVHIITNINSFYCIKRYIHIFILVYNSFFWELWCNVRRVYPNFAKKWTVTLFVNINRVFYRSNCDFDVKTLFEIKLIPFLKKCRLNYFDLTINSDNNYNDDLLTERTHIKLLRNTYIYIILF